MTPVNASVAVSLLLLAVVVSYQMGQRIGSLGAAEPTIPVAAAEPDEVEAALSRRPNESVLRPATSPPTPARTGLESVQAQRPAAQAPRATPTSPPPAAQNGSQRVTAAANPNQRVPGLTYVVLESFKAEHKASAEFAQKWLADRQVPTRLESTSSGWRLVSVQGFEGRDEQRYLQYVGQVKTLGKDCNRDMQRAGVANYLFASPGRFTEQ